MTDSGTCSMTQLNCKVGYYCPTESRNVVPCLPCSEDIKLGQGCYCKDNRPVRNCQECINGFCSKCLPGSFKTGPFCPNCQFGCGQCTDLNSCIKCADGFIMDEASKECIVNCTNNKQCQDNSKGYCNIETSRCEECDSACYVCSSNKFCNACDPFEFVTSIDGRCMPQCSILNNGQYCNNGVAEKCVDGLISECLCNGFQNCASCSNDNSRCASCMQNLVLNNAGQCLDCAQGYVKVGRFCSPDGSSPSTNNMSGGAIAGIIIAVLVVIGAVIGLIILLLRKNKKTQPISGVKRDLI
ncbi:Cysteine-rich membrane protein 1 [Spironucleus salmonicida]|uniref:Cysteine-rich membrane protein 1 n=1 Tax=Spironucleus salmonicida TaxID=348837 RepID=V6LUQ5_9EUKA|nr:Cysteine-rich membrane protein 1 [Spironucleus salmonicida]|eukprot:EST44539.1 Cysteine-rich membrane protein 1 [Spironucleus salmonicida]